MNPVNRRRFLQLSGLTLGALGVAGCGGTSAAGDSTKIVWWDHFGPLQDLHKAWFEEYHEKHPDVQVDHQFYTGEKMWQAIQVAKQSNQMPDVFTLAGSDYPPASLIDQEWLQPITLTEDAKQQLPDGSLLDGITVFDDAVYSFPIFSWRQFTGLNWFNKELVQQAGLDPADPPQTYEQFRSAARAIVQKTEAFGHLWFFKTDPDGHVNDMAQAAGFEGLNGVEFRTGEFAYHSEPYLRVIEFMHSLYVDKLMAPGSRSIDANQARLRFAAGESAYWFEGPWAPGVINDEAEQFMPKLDVGPMLVPDEGMPLVTYRPPVGGVFWLGQNSQHPDIASEVMSTFASPDYARRVSENMDQPPADLSTVSESEAHPAWKKAIGIFEESTYLAPSPAVGNADESAVSAHIKPTEPGLADILEGLFAGKIKNIEQALKDLSERSAEARSDAIDAAKKDGADVSDDMYAFPNWKPKRDYSEEMYQA